MEDMKYHCISDGIFPDPRNCSTFFYCKHGNLKACKCWCKEVNMLFHEKSGRCKYTEAGAINLNCSLSNTSDNSKTFPTRKHKASLAELQHNESSILLHTPRTETERLRSTPREPQGLRGKSDLTHLKAIQSNSDSLKERRHGTFLSKDYRVNTGGLGSNVIHDKPRVPMWVLAVLTVICVVIILAIAMHFYDYSQ